MREDEGRLRIFFLLSLSFDFSSVVFIVMSFVFSFFGSWGFILGRVPPEGGTTASGDFIL